MSDAHTLFAITLFIAGDFVAKPHFTCPTGHNRNQEGDQGGPWTPLAGAK